MEHKIIFRTKLDNNFNYQGVEVLDSEISLSDKDLSLLNDIEKRMYNSQNHLVEEESIELSIGSVIVKGYVNPSTRRRRIIEGFIEVPEVQEVVDQESVKIDNRAKELFIKFLKDLLTLRQATEDDTEKVILEQIEYLLNQLGDENWNIEGQTLLINSLEWLKHNFNKENKKTRAIITCIQELI